MQFCRRSEWRRRKISFSIDHAKIGVKLETVGSQRVKRDRTNYSQETTGT